MTEDPRQETKPVPDRLPYIAARLPRTMVFTCLIFWGFAAAAIAFSTETFHAYGIAVLLAFGLVATGIAIFLGMRMSRALSSELLELEALVSDDAKGSSPKTHYAEFERIAQRVKLRRRGFRDEIEILQRAAFRDGSTGLPNALSLRSALKKSLQHSSRNEPVTFFNVRFDGLARAGDSLGATGSRTLLAEVSARISMLLATLESDETLGIKDTFLAAIGPGEFGILLPVGCDREKASKIARDIRYLFVQPFDVEGRTIKADVSGGISVAPDDGDMADAILKNAGMALDEVRRSKKNGFQFFTPRLERLAIGRQRFEQELREAVASEAFQPVFQPKICFQTGRIVGVEALARWYRGEGRMISPGTFIPLAEELGLVEEIGFQILRQACTAAARWMQDGYPVSVAVNVAPSQFQQKDFINQVVDALRFAGLPPRFLELEITETMAVSDPQRVIDVMQPLRAMGIKLAIDDFGTGHANLSLLTQLPFDIFKIDRQFVSDLEKDSQSPAIVEMILAMAETLGLQTVAEGVETENQAAFLRRRGCTLGQGFLFSRGIPDAELRTLMHDWKRLDATG
ncbi:MAG: bifunctional diguanylate cyclase/phosphodiesterase [Pseudomonadota bacterium]